MKVIFIFLFSISLFLNQSVNAQSCVTISGAGELAANGTYSIMAGPNLQGGLRFKHISANYYLHQVPGINWTINADSSSASLAPVYYDNTTGAGAALSAVTAGWNPVSGIAPAPSLAYMSIAITTSPNTSPNQNSFVTLSGSGAASYTWSGPQTVTNASSFIMTAAHIGTYTVVGTDALGCTASANVTLSMNTINYGSDALIWGCSPFQDSMWSFDPNNNYNVVHRISPSLSGFTITGITGMAVDPCTHKVYLILKLSGVTGRVLATIDLPSGVCTQVGNLGDNFSSITFHANGQLYGATGNGAAVPETLYSIDKNTAAKTLVFSMGNGADGEIICYNPGDNMFYHWSGNGTPVFEKWSANNISYTPTNIPVTGSPGGETFGVYCLKNDSFLISNIASSFLYCSTAGQYGTTVSGTPDDIRGVVVPPVVKLSKHVVCGFNDPVTVRTSGTQFHTIYYIWGDGLVDTVAGIANVSHTYSNIGNKFVKIVANNGFCTDTLLKDTVVVFTKPIVTISGPNAVCSGTPITLSGSAGGSSQWYRNGSPISGATTNTLSVTLAGAYNMIKTNLNGCFDSAASSKIINAGGVTGLTANVSPSPILSIGSSVTLFGTGSGASTFTWAGPQSVSNNVAFTATAAHAGVYTVTAADVYLCTATATIQLNVVNYGLNALIWGASPFQDSIWSFDPNNNFNVVDRKAPSLTGYTITGTTGLALDPCTHKVYVVLKLSGFPTRYLATINLSNAQCTLIGDLGDKFSSITFSASGQLYGVTGNGATVPETMYLIDKNTAAKTLATPLGNGADGEIICYNPSDDQIYHWSGNSTVVFEKFPSLAPYTPITNLPIVGPSGGETFGALCVDSNYLLISNIASNFQYITKTGNYLNTIGGAPDDIRGLVMPPVVSVDKHLLCGLSTPVNVSLAGTQWHTSYVLWGDGITDTVKGIGSKTHTYASTGIKILRVILTNGVCTDTLLRDTIIVGTVPIVNISGPNAFCTGSSINLSGTSGGSFQWYLNGVAIPGANTNTLAVNAAGSYNMTRTNLTGCTDSSATPKVVVENSLPVVTGSATPNPICVGDSSLLSASGASTYLWNPGAIVNSGKVSPAAATTYTVIGTDAAGCSASSTVVLNTTSFINGSGAPDPELLYYKFNGSGTSVPNLALTPPSGTANATIMGSITQGGSGLEGGALIGSGITSTTDYLNTGWAPSLGTNSWTIAFWSQGISVNSTLYYIFGDVGTNSFRCFTNGVAGANNWILRGAGLTDVLLNNGALNTPTHNAFVYDNVNNNVKAYLNGVLVNTVAQVTPNVNGSGPFKVMGYSSNIGSPSGGKLDEFRVYNRALDISEIQQLLNFIPAFGIVASDTVICQGNAISLYGNNNIYTNQTWQPGTVLADTLNTIPTATTNYSLTVTDANGCKATFTKLIEVHPSPVAVIANPTNPITGDNVIFSATPDSANYNYAWAGNYTFSTNTDSVVLNNVSSLNSGIYTLTVTDNLSGCVDTATYALTVNPRVTLPLKAFLSGPYVTALGTMHDSLRSKGFIPLTEPYSGPTYNAAFTHVNGGGGETVAPSILSVTGNDAIVDWVFVELRNSAAPATVLATQAALIQRDGDIVSARDGISPIVFKNSVPGNYYVALRHRNHLGVMTKSAIALGETSSPINFSATTTALNRNATNNNTFVYTATQDSCTRIFSGVRALYGGNCNITTSGAAHKNIRYNGINNDRLTILSTSGAVATLAGYYKEDLNMNGEVRYNGVNNDRIVLLQNIGTISSNTVYEQTQ